MPFKAMRRKMARFLVNEFERFLEADGKFSVALRRI